MRKKRRKSRKRMCFFDAVEAKSKSAAERKNQRTVSAYAASERTIKFKVLQRVSRLKQK